MLKVKMNCALVAISILASSVSMTVPGFCGVQAQPLVRDRITLSLIYRPSHCESVRAGEIDYFSLYLTYPALINISASGFGGLQPFLTLMDGNRNLLAFDNGSVSRQDTRIERRLSPGFYLIDLAGFNGTTGSYCLRIRDIVAASEIRAPLFSYETEEMLKKVLWGGVIAGAYLGMAAYQRESRYDANPEGNPFGKINAMTGGAAVGFTAVTVLTILALKDSIGDGLNAYYAAPGLIALALGAGIVGAIAGGAVGFNFREEIASNRALYYGASVLTIAVPIFIISID